MIGPATVSEKPVALEKGVVAVPREAAVRRVGAGPELVRVEGSKLVR